MIRKYRIGTPIETESVVREVEITPGTPAELAWDEPNKTFSMPLSEDAIVYGLGETVRGINKRGWTYISNCADDPIHLESKNSLYAAHNFFVVADHECVKGFYVDTPVKTEFDIGYTRMDMLYIRMDEPDVNLYVIDPEITGTPSKATKEDTLIRRVVRQFRYLIGRSYLPPRWAFGYGQSRWGYLSEDDINAVIEGYEKSDIPLDSVYMDIDYMERYKDFTLNDETFPDFPAFVKSVRDKNIHLVPIIDAGVKIEDGYDVYEEGIKGDYFCKKEDGSPLVAAVWPGKVHFPDFLKPETRSWFGAKYDFLIRQGIDGFWNDMNEPAIFYTEDGLKQTFEKIKTYEGRNLDIQSFFDFTGMVSGISNSPEDYRSFYHAYHGENIRHDRVHNLYGFNMTRAAGEAMEKLSPDKRLLLFSRSSYIGMHRYGGVWTGDNQSWWSHILLNIQQMPGLNMCGFLYSGADTGGFGANCTEDILLRWLGVSLYTPLFRNHAALGTRDQELYRFPHADWMRGLIRLRYRLIPYIYSEFMKAALNDDLYIQPLSFVYPEDERALHVEDQLLVGESLMVAPVYVQNAVGRMVYLPEEMKMLRFKGDVLTEETILPAGDHYIPVALKEVVMFLRKGHALPLTEAAKTTKELDYEHLKYVCFDASADSYELYMDDGESRIPE